MPTFFKLHQLKLQLHIVYIIYMHLNKGIHSANCKENIEIAKKA